MKTLKIITTLATLNLVLFMSVSTIANPFSISTGDIVKTNVLNQKEAVKGPLSENAPTASIENEFSPLRFDVNKFSTENGDTELPLNSLNYLRFDVSNYTEVSRLEITELPLVNEFDYMRFNPSDFGNPSELNEMPIGEFDSLRYDVNNFLHQTSAAMDELPVN